jgi:hypothetical protein
MCPIKTILSDEIHPTRVTIDLFSSRVVLDRRGMNKSLISSKKTAHKGRQEMPVLWSSPGSHKRSLKGQILLLHL